MTSPLNNLTDTWNNSGTVFTGLKYNITNTASAAGSLLCDFQIGGASRFSVNKLGYILAGDGSNVGMLFWGGEGATGRGIKAGSGGLEIYDTTGAFGLGVSAAEVALAETGRLNWKSASLLDLYLFKEQTVSTGAALAQRNGANAQTLRVYNTYTDASNYERGVFDWTTTSNTLTIGTQALGSGSARSVAIVSASAISCNVPGGQQFAFNVGGSQVAGMSSAGGVSSSVGIYTFQPGPNLPVVSSDNSNPIVHFGNTGLSGAAGDHTGWMNWGGQKRVTSDFDTGNSTTLANITGLSIAVLAGRTYSFEAVVPTTSNSAAGVKFAIAGTATATNITYEAVVYSAGSIVVQTRASALATTVGAITAVTAAYCRITGTITVNAAGTLTVQIAQNVGNATGSVALRGSSFTAYDMP